jgi:K+-transporting ATPase ATPase A chain
MPWQNYTQVVAYAALLVVLAVPLGFMMARVYEGRTGWLGRFLGPVERAFYRIAGVRIDADMSWKQYTLAVIAFQIVGLAFVYAIQRLQGILPWNPAGMPAVPPDLAFNTAVSFTTNTNWQSYGGETTLSYLTQMLALTVQNFVSAATGMAVLVALARGLRAREAASIGNFWVDLTRTTLYILLPLAFVLALVLVSQGVVQTMSPYHTVTLLEPQPVQTPGLDASGAPVLDAQGIPTTETSMRTEQTIAVGPAASQVAIKQLGTNGGGFFNANSAHPLENPTPLSNFLEMLAILVIPAALCFTFGVMVRDVRQGWAVFAAMTIIFVGVLLLTIGAEQAGNPHLAAIGADQRVSAAHSGGNMEGKETRFGIVNSALWATATTAASNGSVNAMHDSFTPLGGMVPMWLIQLGEIIYGGVGSGLYGMLVFVIVAVFLSGLMVGRTPEYLGKKIGAFEVQMASVAILAPAACILVGTAIGVVWQPGLKGMSNPAAHGFSEVLYAFSSAAGNNGSAFAGLGANSMFYNTALGIVMLIGRYWILVPVLAIAGSMAAKKITPAGPGTFPTHTPLFVVILIGTILLVGALTYLPALALGPIVEHLQMTGS